MHLALATGEGAGREIETSGLAGRGPPRSCSRRIMRNPLRL